MDDFKDRFGLGWKYNAEKPRESSSSSEQRSSAHDVIENDAAVRGLEDALIFYSRPFLERLKNAPGKKARLFDVASDINVRVEVAIPVERYLVTHGYVTRLEEDKLGNDVLKLTEAGEMKLGI